MGGGGLGGGGSGMAVEGGVEIEVEGGETRRVRSGVSMNHVGVWIGGAKPYKIYTYCKMSLYFHNLDNNKY